MTMTDQILTDIGIQGSLADMSLSNVLSRTVEDSAGIVAGLPVTQGVADNGCTAGIAAGEFAGITVAEFGVDTAAQGSSVGVLAQGAIWLTAGGTINAGNQVMTTPAGVYTAYVAATAGNFKLDGVAETSAASGSVFKFRLNSTDSVAA